MPVVSFRVTEEEKNWMESYATMHRLNLSEAIKQAFFEKLEDEYDQSVVKAHEAEKESNQVTYHTFEEVKQELGFHDETV